MIVVGENKILYLTFSSKLTKFTPDTVTLVGDGVRGIQKIMKEITYSFFMTIALKYDDINLFSNKTKTFTYLP